jgi:2-aminobenzoate-CoA ligase
MILDQDDLPMKDRYPAYPTIPAGCLVPEELQPEYRPLPGCDLPDDANLALRILAAGAPDAVAIVHHESGRTLTYAELGDAALRLAGGLHEAGIRPGDRVAYRGPNRPELIVAALAAWRLGAVIVPVPVQTRADELRFFLEDTDARLLLASSAELEAARDGAVAERVVAFGSDDWHALLASSPYDGPVPPADAVAIIWHTGGTTGVPKGTYHTHRRFLLAGYACAQALGTTPDRRWLAAAPLGHGLAVLCNITYSLLHGASIVLVEEYQRPEQLLAAIERHRVTICMGLAVTWARMLEVLEAGAEHDLSSIETGYAMWQSASSAHVREAWLERGIELLNNFGSTSFATWVLVPRPGDRVPPASLGRAAPGYEVAAIDPDAPVPTPLPAGTAGRMAVRGPSGLTYWNRPQLQARDVVAGWTLADDLIRLDSDGMAEYLGRTDYLISTAGFKVAPAEVEQVLARHAAVEEVAVIGLPDPLRQEVVAAFVVLADGAEPGESLKRELQAFVREQLSPYKYPRRVEFIDRLPRDAVGKVVPRLLRDRESGTAGGRSAC